MGYTPITINAGDPAEASWANKVEQHLGRLGNYRGVIDDAANLPDPTSVDEGDWYLVKNQRSAFVAQNSKWLRLSSVASSIVSTLKINLFDTAGEYEGLYYCDIAFTELGPFQVEAVARITANLGKDHKLRVSIGGESGESNPFITGNDQVVVAIVSPSITPPAIETAQVDILFNISITNEIPSGTIDGNNTSFQLSQHPVTPGTVTLTVDSTSTVTDDGAGNLSDGGSIDYATGAVVLGTAPSSSLSADYEVGKVQNETPSGTIDGNNTSFSCAFSPIVPKTVKVVADETEYLDDGNGNLIKEILDETPSGTIDSSNTSFTLAFTPIKAGSLTLTIDGSTTVTDNGDGTLSDGGTIDYNSGSITLTNAPTSSLTADYVALNGTIDYDAGTLSLVNAPSSSLTIDYEIVGGYIDFLELRWF